MLMSSPPPLFLCTLKKCSSFYHIKSITFSCVLLMCNHHSANDRFLAKVKVYVVCNVTLLGVLWQSHLKHLTRGRTSLQIVLHISAILQGRHGFSSCKFQVMNPKSIAKDVHRAFFLYTQRWTHLPHSIVDKCQMLHLSNITELAWLYAQITWVLTFQSIQLLIGWLPSC